MEGHYNMFILKSRGTGQLLVLEYGRNAGMSKHVGQIATLILMRNISGSLRDRDTFGPVWASNYPATTTGGQISSG